MKKHTVLSTLLIIPLLPTATLTTIF